MPTTTPPGNARSPRQRRHARTRRAILEAARGILAEEGADSLSMREIARRIDYSPAGLYEYFEGKDAIVEAVCDEGTARLQAALAEVPTSLPPAERVEALGRAYLAFAFANAEHYKLMFTAPRPTSERASPPDGGPYAILQAAIADGIAAGVFQPRPGFAMPAMAYAAWTLVHGIAMLRLTRLGTEAPELDETDRQAVAALVRGFSSPMR